MATPTSGITNFIQSVNGGISGFQITFGPTDTKATLTFTQPPIPPNWTWSTVEVHWFNPALNNSGSLTANGGTYTFSISGVSGSSIQVQVVFWATAQSNEPATFNSGPIQQSGGVGTSINEMGLNFFGSPTTQVTVNVVMSGGGGMN